MEPKEWAFYEDESRKLFNRVVYSDEDEFYEYESRPLRTILIKKMDAKAYILVYNTSTGMFKRYVIPYYKRSDAHIQIKPLDDEPDTRDDFRTSVHFTDEYRVSTTVCP
jgi:hypothetical protein